MPDATTELNLQLALGTDDTADYLTSKLRQSLQSLDSTYNQASGHNHSGPHQGGLIHAAAFGGAMDLPDWFRSTGQRSGFPSSGQGIELYWSGTNGVLQSYDRGASVYRPMIFESSVYTFGIAGTSVLTLDANGLHVLHADGTGGGWIRARAGAAGLEFINDAYNAVNVGIDDSGNVTVRGTLVAGATQLNGTLAVGGAVTFSSTLNASGSVTGSEFHANNGNLYLGSAHLFDAGGGSLSLGGGLNAGSATLSGLTVNGTINASGTITAPTVNSSGNHSVQNNPNNVVPYTTGGTAEHIEHGRATVSGVGNGSSANLSQSFSRAFASNPIVLVAIDTPSSGDIQNWHVAAQGVSTTGFNIRVNNSSGSTGNCSVCWFAMGA
jgi:H-type lectin domain-containing protein